MKGTLKKLLTTTSSVGFERYLKRLFDERNALLGSSISLRPVYQSQMKHIWIERLRKALIDCIDVPYLSDRLSMLNMQRPGHPVIQEMCLCYAQIIELHAEIYRNTVGKESCCSCTIS